MIKKKLGNGGHSLEIYDDSDGKYVSVEFSVVGVDGQTYKISSFDDYVKANLTSDQFALYENEMSADEQEAVKDYFFDDYQNEVQGEIDKRNADNTQDKEIVTYSGMEVVDKIGEIITPDFAQTFMEEYRKIGRTSVNYDGKSYGYLPLLPIKFQSQRFGTAFFKQGDEKEFLDAYEVPYTRADNTAYADIILEKARNGEKIKIYRGVGNSDYTKAEVQNSFFGESDGIQTLLGTGYYDSVIYCSLRKSYSSSYASNSRAVLMHGYVDLSKATVLNAMQRVSNGYNWNTQNEDLTYIKRNVNILLDNLKNSLDGTSMDDNDKNQFLDIVRDCCDDNVGFCGMLMGVDAIIGIDGQLDIINPNCAKMLR